LYILGTEDKLAPHVLYQLYFMPGSMQFLVYNITFN
jgi:hypothetical protein